MKKLISILVVFALLTAVAFAQDEGTWSVGGAGRIGTKIDFIPMQSFQLPVGNEQWGHATITEGDADGNPGGRGTFDLTYKRGGLTTGFAFNQRGDINAKLSYAGTNWNFNAEQNLNALLTGTGRPGNTQQYGSLWGNYTFQVLNGIFLEAAVKRETDPWKATSILGDVFSKNVTGSQNYLMANVLPMAGLEIGFKLPNFFQNFSGTGNDRPRPDFVVDGLQFTVFGAKYAEGALTAAFQLALNGQAHRYNDKGEETTKDDADLNSKIYLGAEYKITDQITAGLEFRGFFGGQRWYATGQVIGESGDTKYVIEDATGIEIGARFAYSDGPLSASIQLKFRDNDTTAIPTGTPPFTYYQKWYDHNGTFEVAPEISYNVVDGYLQAKLGASLTFSERAKLQQSEDLKSANDTVFETRVKYSFTPQLTFNFLGTGAGNYDTGFHVRYVVEGMFDDPVPPGQTSNQLRIVFQWKF